MKISFSRTFSKIRTKVWSLLNLKTSQRPNSTFKCSHMSLASSGWELPVKTLSPSYSGMQTYPLIFPAAFVKLFRQKYLNVFENHARKAAKDYNITLRNSGYICFMIASIGSLFQSLIVRLQLGAGLKCNSTL